MIKYFGDFRQAMIANINLGGDNCNRAVLIGFLLGCTHRERIPEEWINGLLNHKELSVLISETTQYLQKSEGRIKGHFLSDGKANLCNLNYPLPLPSNDINKANPLVCESCAEGVCRIRKV